MRITHPVCVLGGFGLGNFGDDLLMVADLRILTRVCAPTDVAVLGYRNNYCDALFAGPHYAHRDFGPNYVESDLVIYGGGTQFYAHGGAARPASRWQKTLALWRAIRAGWVPVSRLWKRGRPVVHLRPDARVAAVSLGLGPFSRPDAEEEARRKLTECEYIHIRDNVSFELCRRWNLDHARLWPDFGHAIDLWCPNAPPARERNELHRVGVVVRDWPHNSDIARHLNASLALAAALKRDQIEVRFFVFGEPTDPNCTAALRRSPYETVVWRPRRQSLSFFVESLAACDMLVTARYHAAVVGAGLGVPSVCTEIEPKLRRAAEDLGAGAECWAPPFDLQDGLQRVRALTERLPAASRAVQQRAATLRDGAVQAADEFETYLRSALASPI